MRSRRPGYRYKKTACDGRLLMFSINCIKYISDQSTVCKFLTIIYRQVKQILLFGDCFLFDMAVNLSLLAESDNIGGTFIIKMFVRRICICLFTVIRTSKNDAVNKAYRLKQNVEVLLK